MKLAFTKRVIRDTGEYISYSRFVTGNKINTCLGNMKQVEGVEDKTSIVYRICKP